VTWATLLGLSGAVLDTSSVSATFGH